MVPPLWCLNDRPLGFGDLDTFRSLGCFYLRPCLPTPFSEGLLGGQYKWEIVTFFLVSHSHPSCSTSTLVANLEDPKDSGWGGAGSYYFSYIDCGLPSYRGSVLILLDLRKLCEGM